MPTFEYPHNVHTNVPEPEPTGGGGGGAVVGSHHFGGPPTENFHVDKVYMRICVWLRILFYVCGFENWILCFVCAQILMDGTTFKGWVHKTNKQLQWVSGCDFLQY